MTGFQPIGYEFAAELTFPEPDGPVSAILNISTQIFGIVITLVISGIMQILGDFYGNMVWTNYVYITRTQLIGILYFCFRYSRDFW